MTSPVVSAVYPLEKTIYALGLCDEACKADGLPDCKARVLFEWMVKQSAHACNCLSGHRWIWQSPVCKTTCVKPKVYRGFVLPGNSYFTGLEGKVSCLMSFVSSLLLCILTSMAYAKNACAVIYPFQAPTPWSFSQSKELIGKETVDTLAFSC